MKTLVPTTIGKTHLKKDFQASETAPWSDDEPIRKIHRGKVGTSKHEVPKVLPPEVRPEGCPCKKSNPNSLQSCKYIISNKIASMYT